jgi:hypothetical protein
MEYIVGSILTNQCPARQSYLDDEMDLLLASTTTSLDIHRHLYTKMANVALIGATGMVVSVIPAS